MSTPVPLRSDFDAVQLHKLARGSRDPDQFLALAEVYAGGSRSNAARIGGVGLQIVRDWVLGFNAEGPDGLLNGKAPGVPSILDDNQRRALRQIVEDALSQPSMASCAGALSIWRNGRSRSFASRSQSKL
jgi:transposase